MSSGMQHNSEIIISDTSCLILLFKIGELDLLKSLSENVYITTIIQAEFTKPLPEWIKIKSPSDKHYQQILEMDLDSGEASAIALSLETENSILVIDDLKGRKIAAKLNIRYSGTFGLILKAKQAGILTTITPILNKIKATDFRFSEKLFETIIREAGE
jgi:predicted nucleic acid-binding protein